jgi:glutaredoxin
MRHLLILGLLIASPFAQAETYRWVDSAGRVMISDTPPAGAAKHVIKTDETPTASDNLPFAVKKAMETYPVTLYTSADCLAECKLARELLNKRGVPFSEKVVQKQEDLDELKALIGEAVVPALKVGKQSTRGFQASIYDNLLDLAGYPKTAPYGSKPSGGPAK